MDNSSVSSLQEIRKAAKKAKSKMKNNTYKPVKVVYISNPMKVKTSASKFRALVQELTGQDAELPDPTKFTDTDEDVLGGNQTVLDAAKDSADHHAQEVPRLEELPSAHHHHHHEKRYSSRAQDHDVPFESFDELFTSEMLENFTGLLPTGLLL
ncbi:hypothetical protein REPUB_Repub06bG0109600 [Reevesia pubescens]